MHIWDVSDVILPNCYYCCRSWTSCCVARYASITTRQPCSPLSVPTTVCSYNVMYIHVLMRDEKEGRKKQANDKAKQHSTPKAVTFPKKSELTQMGLEPTTLHSRQSALPCTCAYIHTHTHTLTHTHTHTREP